MNIKDLWIGEKVLIKSSGEVGTYEGLGKDGNAKIKINRTIGFYESRDLEIYVEKEDFGFHIEEEMPLNKIIKKINFEHQLDLHIEVLAPHLINATPSRIVEYQIQSFKNYMSEAHASKIYKVTIIHGKGEGVLRSEIHHLLEMDSRVRLKNLTNNDGATEVWLG